MGLVFFGVATADNHSSSRMFGVKDSIRDVRSLPSLVSSYWISAWREPCFDRSIIGEPLSSRGIEYGDSDSLRARHWRPPS